MPCRMFLDVPHPTVVGLENVGKTGQGPRRHLCCPCTARSRLCRRCLHIIPSHCCAGRLLFDHVNEIEQIVRVVLEPPRGGSCHPIPWADVDPAVGVLRAPVLWDLCLGKSLNAGCRVSSFLASPINATGSPGSTAPLHATARALSFGSGRDPVILSLQLTRIQQSPWSAGILPPPGAVLLLSRAIFHRPPAVRPSGPSTVLPRTWTSQSAPRITPPAEPGSIHEVKRRKEGGRHNHQDKASLEGTPPRAATRQGSVVAARKREAHVKANVSRRRLTKVLHLDLLEVHLLPSWTA